MADFNTCGMSISDPFISAKECYDAYQKTAQQNAPKLSLKLYDDKITLSRYRAPKPRYKWYSRKYKIDLETGILEPWGIIDSYRRSTSALASLYRAKRNIRELSERNRFFWFLTVTFNGEYVNRKSAGKVHKKFKNVIKRLKYCYGALAYIAVAEFHEDGSIHYHLMINFAVDPKPIRTGKYTPKGHAIWHFREDFFRKDCFMTLEKLTEQNNVEYLIKYMTKGQNSPLSHRFSCSRGLARRRMVDAIKLSKDWHDIKKTALKMGFYTAFDNGLAQSYVYTSAGASGGAATRADLSMIDTKDEKQNEFAEIFYALVQNGLKTARVKVKIWSLQGSNLQQSARQAKIRALRCNPIGQQLAFDVE